MVDGDIVLSVGLDAGNAVATSEQLEEDIKQIFSSSSGAEPVGFKNLQVQMDALITRSHDIRAMMDELGQIEIPTDAYTEMSEQLASLQGQIESMVAEAQDIFDRYQAHGGVFELPDDEQRFAEIEQSIRPLKQEYFDLYEARQQLEQSGNAYISGAETEEYSRLGQQLNQVNNKLVILKQRAVEAGSDGAQAGNRLVSSYSNVASSSNKLNNSMRSLLSTMKRVAGSAISSGIRTLTSRFTGLNKSSDDMNKSLQRGFKLLIKYAFGVRSFFFLYRKIRKAITEGIGEMAKFHEPLNSAMSQIMTSLRSLRNTLAASFAPLIEYVAPALTAFINKLAEAISKIGQFIATLTGKQYVQAGTTYIDYAKSLDKSTASSNSATKATKAQTKAQKELNREVTHFDDLVILHDKNKDNTDTTPTTTTAPTSTFTPVPVGDAVAKFAKDFLAAWSKADFTDIGRIVGEKLKKALDNIPWEKIQATTRKIAKSVATFLNGFLETPGLFTSIGRTVGQAINTALAGLSTFAWNFHWRSLGRAINDAVKEALLTINWDDAYSAAQGFGVGFAEFLNSLITPETFGLIGETLAEVLNVAFTFLATFGEKFDWKNFGESLAEGLNRFLGKLDIEKFKKGIKAFVFGIRDSIITWLDKVNWYKFGTTLRDIIEAIPWTTLLKSFGEILWHAIKAVINLAKGLFIGDTTIGGPVVEAFSNLQETVDSIAEDIDFDAIAKGFKAVVDALAPATEAWAVGFINTFDTLFKIGKAFLEALGPALQAIADALNEIDPDVLSDIGYAFGEIAAAFLGFKAVSGVFSMVGGLFTTISGASTGVQAATGALSGLFGQIAGGLGVTAVVHDNFEKINKDQETMEQVTSDNGSALLLVTQAFEEVGIKGDWFGLKLTGVTNNLSMLGGEIPDFETAFTSACQEFEDGGGDVEAFKTRLKEMLNAGAFGTKEAAIIKGYIGDIGTEASTAGEDTTGFADTFDAFNGLSLTTPLKLALLGTAIKLLGDNGALSQDEVSDLQSELDKVDVEHPEKGMSDLQTAFSKTGVSAGMFKTTLIGAMLGMKSSTKENMDAAIKTIEDAGPDLKKKSKSSFKNVADGAKKGLDDNASKVVDAAGTMMGDTLDELDETAESNSPSKRTIRLGRYIAEGLKIGINNLKPTLITTASVTITAIMTTMQNLTSRFTPIGSGYVGAVINGINSMAYRMYSTGSGMGNSAKNGFASVSFWGVGYNAGVGIYNGLVATSSWLRTLAWNTAVAMYNAACKALNIASPSKKFAYVGEMVARGLGKGVDDYQDVATDAVTDMTDAMLEEAETANTSMQFDATVGSWIDSLDNVLTEFSNTIIDRFDNLINVLVQLSNVSSFVPAVAQGKVIPSSLRAANDTADTTSALMGMLENLTMNQMTAEDLRPLLVEMFTQYMNLSWRIGDEQLAYHVNRGNLSLERRYSTR